MWHRLTILVALANLLIGILPAVAAEIRLRNTCQVAHGLVTLGDVAEVYAVDVAQQKRLTGIELMPAPLPGSVRYLRAREIHDMLHDRGINNGSHRLSGASVVAISVTDQSPVVAASASLATTDRLRVNDSVIANAQRRATQAIRTHLQIHGQAGAAWRVELAMDEQALAQLATATGKIEVAGGSEPWVGMQQFKLRINTGRKVAELVAPANVSLPDSVVVAVRSLSRGAIIQATDLRLEPGKNFDAPSQHRQLFYDMSEVVGKETTRAVAPGQSLNQQFVREPLLVRRGDVVTVYVRAAGIQVRTTARAREDGSQGDLVSVESLLDRTHYFARVTAIQEVEVYAGATPGRDSRQRNAR